MFDSFYYLFYSHSSSLPFLHSPLSKTKYQYSSLLHLPWEQIIKVGVRLGRALQAIVSSLCLSVCVEVQQDACPVLSCPILSYQFMPWEIHSNNSVEDGLTWQRLCAGTHLGSQHFRKEGYGDEKHIERGLGEDAELVIGCLQEVDRGRGVIMLLYSYLENGGTIQYAGKHGRRNSMEMEQIILRLYVK